MSLKTAVRHALSRVRGSRQPARKPVLGIVGFFGHGNYGDELFLDVYRQYFGDEFELVILPDLAQKPYFSTPVQDRVRDVDAIVIGGGDLVRPWAVDKRYFHPAYLKRPVFMVGLGVPLRADPRSAPNEAAVQRYREFFQHRNVQYVGVRDDVSRDWVRDNLAPTAPLVSAPDMVCALDLPPVTRPEGAPILGIVTRERNRAGDRDDYTRLEELAAHATGLGWRVRHLVLGTGIVGARDVANAEDLAVPDKELVHTEDLDELTRSIGECTVLASMKFHGSVVASMYGRPSFVLIPTLKNRAFMARLDREDLVSRFDATDLIEKFGEQGPAPQDPAAIAALRAGADEMLVDLRGRVLKAVHDRWERLARQEQKRQASAKGTKGAEKA